MKENLRVYTFGGLRIEQAGEPIADVGSRKVEALFIYLALAGRPQPREILADLLWDDRTQQQAQANLRRVLSGLRKHFDPFVEITRTTAALADGQDLWVDVKGFQAGVQPITAGPARLSPETAAQVDAALSLYHGDFMAGFSVRDASGFDAWLTEQREHWRQVVLDAADTLARYYETTYSFTAGIEVARRALQVDPLGENIHRQLMRLLALNGRRTDALQQYETCRQILWDELAVPPAPQTESLYEAIANGDIAPKPASEQPVLSTIQAEAAEPLPKPDDRSAPSNLPSQSTPFIGREAELAALDDLLSDPNVRLITIVGPGGMGKTRLALAAAEGQLIRKDRPQTHPYKDGVYFVPLASVDTSDKIVLALAEQLEFLFHGDSDPADQVLAYLAQQHMLLVFDSFEHLLAGVDFIAMIRQQAPNVTLLVTSRERLLIAGEALYRLGGLSYSEDPNAVPAVPDQAAAEYGAIALFLHHTRLVRSDLVLDQNALLDIARICKLVQGMPLAILLAVSWIETLSLMELGEAIASNIDILTSQQRDLPPRQRSIRAAFEASWGYLTPTDQTVFARLSVFQGGFTRKAAEAVAGATLFTLRTLIEKSLIIPTKPDRYELHGLLRQFAAEKLADGGETDTVRQSHGRYYLDALRSLETDVKGKRQIAAFNEIDADLDNIQRAWAWALSQDQFALIDAALETLTIFCLYTNRAIEGHMLFRAARERVENEKDKRLSGRLLARHVWLKSEYGLEADVIQDELDQSKAIAQQLDDQREIAQVLTTQGYNQIRIHSDLAAGLAAFEQAYQIFEQLGDRFYMSILLARIGYCQIEDPAAAIDYTRRSLALAMKIGNENQAANARANLGDLFIAMGENIAGEQMLEQSWDFETSIGSTIPSTLLALASFLRGDLERMKQYLPPQEQLVIGKVNLIAIPYGFAVNALLAIVNGELALAEQLARQSLNTPSNLEGELLAHWSLAMAYTDRGLVAAARQELSTAYKLTLLKAFPGMMTWSLPVAAVVLAKSGQPERAAQVFSLALNHPASQTGWLQHWKTGSNLRAELEGTLGPGAFQAVWRQGKDLDLVETIESLATTFLDLDRIEKQQDAQ